MEEGLPREEAAAASCCVVGIATAPLSGAPTSSPWGGEFSYGSRRAEHMAQRLGQPRLPSPRGCITAPPVMGLRLPTMSCSTTIAPGGGWDDASAAATEGAGQKGPRQRA